MRLSIVSMAITVTGLTLATGCGTQSTIAVTNLTNYEMVKPDQNFDVVHLSDVNGIMSRLSVEDGTGRPVNLDTINKPILFEAFWCAHCQRTLTLLNHNEELKKDVIVVSTGFPPNTTIRQATQTTERESALLGLSGFRFYYSLDPIDDKLVPSFPTLLFEENRTPMLLTGEHSLSIWKRALEPTDS